MGWGWGKKEDVTAYIYICNNFILNTISVNKHNIASVYIYICKDVITMKKVDQQ